MKKSLLTIAALLIGGATFAQTYVLDKTIPLTGEGGYDYRDCLNKPVLQESAHGGSPHSKPS